MLNRKGVFTGLRIEGHTVRDNVGKRSIIAEVGDELDGIDRRFTLLRRDGDRHRGVGLVIGGCHCLQRRSRYRNQVVQVTASRRYMNGVRRGSRIKSRDQRTIYNQPCQLIAGIQRTLDGQSVIAVVSTVLRPVMDGSRAYAEVTFYRFCRPNDILCLVSYFSGEGENRFLNAFRIGQGNREIIALLLCVEAVCRHRRQRVVEAQCHPIDIHLCFATCRSVFTGFGVKGVKGNIQLRRFFCYRISRRQVHRAGYITARCC